MSKRRLKAALQTLPHTQALKDCTVRPQTFDFDFEEVPNIVHAFRRMTRGLEFDISEMAFTTYLCARDHGKRFTALPIFLVRAFHHGVIAYNTKAGIRTPKDLEGRKVGVERGYTVTAGVWARAVLQHEHGVDLNKITWVLSGDEHVAEYRPPSNVVPIQPGKTLAAMLASGEVAATISVESNHSDVAPLIPNGLDVGLAALKRTGYYPINHTLVVKDEHLQANPDLVQDIFSAFARAKAPYVQNLKNCKPTEVSASEKSLKKVADIIGDPLPYGVAANRRMVEAIIDYASEQKIISRRFAVDELFHPGSLTLAG